MCLRTTHASVHAKREGSGSRQGLDDKTRLKPSFGPKEHFVNAV